MERIREVLGGSYTIRESTNFILLSTVSDLKAAEVLRFRDEAWQTYFTNPAYLALVEQKFGVAQRENVEAMARVPMKRKILGD